MYNKKTDHAKKVLPNLSMKYELDVVHFLTEMVVHFSTEIYTVRTVDSVENRGDVSKRNV